MHEKTLLNFIRVSPFYRELHKIFMDDHPQITIVVQHLIFYSIFNILYFLRVFYFFLVPLWVFFLRGLERCTFFMQNNNNNNS